MSLIFPGCNHVIHCYWNHSCLLSSVAVNILEALPIVYQSQVQQCLPLYLGCRCNCTFKNVEKLYQWMFESITTQFHPDAVSNVGNFTKNEFPSYLIYFLSNCMSNKILNFPWAHFQFLSFISSFSALECPNVMKIQFLKFFGSFLLNDTISFSLLQSIFKKKNEKGYLGSK